MHDYLEAVADGRLPVNRDIIALMQDIFNLLPNLNIKRLAEALTGASRSTMPDWLHPLLLSLRPGVLPAAAGNDTSIPVWKQTLVFGFVEADSCFFLLWLKVEQPPAVTVLLCSARQ